MSDWYPGKMPTREEELEAEIRRLRGIIAKQAKELADYSWRLNPDRSGGAFTDEEKLREYERW